MDLISCVPIMPSDPQDASYKSLFTSPT
ncbi:MAG: hypothetical protein RLZZ123_2798, partial [Pseudomonadota bacterium]